MGAEIGATTSLFPYDANMAAYLKATGREAIADAANQVASDLRPDPEVEADPSRFFDRVVEIDLTTLEPLINGPHTPDLAHKVSEIGAAAKQNDWPLDDLVGARRFLHELVVRGHHPSRIDRPPSGGQGSHLEDTAADHTRLRAGAGDDRT